MSRLAELAGGTAAAASALAVLRADPARAAMVAPDDPRITGGHGDHPRGHPAAERLSGPARPAPTASCRRWSSCTRIAASTRTPRTWRAGSRPTGSWRWRSTSCRRRAARPRDEDKARDMIGTLDAGKVVSRCGGRRRLAQGAPRQQRQGRHRRLLLGRRRGRAGRRGRPGSRCRRGLLRPGAGDRHRGQHQGAAAAELCRPGRPHQCRRPGVRGGAEGGRQDLHALPLRGRQPRLQQRHLGGALQRGGGQARLGAHDRLLQGEPRDRRPEPHPPQAQLAGRPPPSQAGVASG